MTNTRNHLISAIDRNGRTHSTDEMKVVFKKLYHLNIDAISLMFPDMTLKAIHRRAESYRISGKYRKFTGNDLELIRRLWPNYAAICKELGRPKWQVMKRCYKLGLSLPDSAAWSEDDLATLRQGKTPIGRTYKAASSKRMKLGITLGNIRSVQAIEPDTLIKEIGEHVHEGNRPHIREEIVYSVYRECLEGRCGASPAALAKAAAKARTAVYKLHPERGAPLSMDAKLFDDGSATVGDRISSDTFHF
ncbi:hypothetical protein [Methylobacterium sp.]|uniref:hypothetical protein n=1 Tax=Methylobacterium sp. TaxID=409 RepID=UPI003B01BDBB